MYILQLTKTKACSVRCVRVYVKRTEDLLTICVTKPSDLNWMPAAHMWLHVEQGAVSMYAYMCACISARMSLQ